MGEIEREQLRLAIELEHIRKRARLFMTVDIIIANLFISAGLAAGFFLGAIFLMFLLGLFVASPFILHALYLEWRFRPISGGRRMTHAERIEAEVERRLQEAMKRKHDDLHPPALAEPVSLEDLFIGDDGELYSADEDTTMNRNKA